MAPSIPSPNITIPAIPLTPNSFAAFGSVITSPLPAFTTAIPSPPPTGSVLANQNTALKYPNISPFTSNYHQSPSGAPAQPTMSLFACLPRTLRPSPTSKNASIFDIRILERHPYTTQTFVPLSPSSNAKAIIIVAPTLPSPPPPSMLTPYFPQSKQSGPPDLTNLKAFVAEPGIGVTYGVGTWHAPMVVVGKRVDFVVSQFMSGREGEDCQEVEVGEGLEVVVNMGSKSGRSRL
ncbi:hypothetical protein MMC28_008911 [Mycoblastus sanguinarius]|nr:hypothetical protein [Mycoblastus sanguinarius]